MKLHSTPSPQCKICDSSPELYGVTDFNVSCYGNNVHRYNYPLSGHAIYYYKCKNCGLIYTHAFDTWSDDDYSQHIYNAEYTKHDPNFISKRSTHNFNLLHNAFKNLKSFRMIDFGCGDGQLVKLLREYGTDAVGWDPFNNSAPMPEERFEFMTSFEVMEHTPTPVKTMEIIDSLLDQENGKYFFSTLTNDLHLAELMNFWYIAPRNGHITIHSNKSLDVLFAKFGMKVKHISELYHLAYKHRD
ncbi:class I SAM-dependent methyltransferase [Citrobacter sp. MGH110]|uniref:class I SAM-dependent methyltransferase n=1 Tax=Citrobacter sp. MGH110 TaxID=1686383 RepID=UPI000650407C|nr:class I SAM-dependent methyltransferase [Citrobacter sp. MGH110]KLV72159.1 hypothetical protein SK38_02602 [Citrobacter sp. MGH110]